MFTMYFEKLTCCVIMSWSGRVSILLVTGGLGHRKWTHYECYVWCLAVDCSRVCEYTQQNSDA